MSKMASATGRHAYTYKLKALKINDNNSNHRQVHVIHYVSVLHICIGQLLYYNMSWCQTTTSTLVATTLTWENLWNWTTLVRVLVCCLAASGDHLNIDDISKGIKGVSSYSGCENYRCKILATSLMGHWVYTAGHGWGILCLEGINWLFLCGWY